MKTFIYNLIILDESGSMCDVTKQTISGCNETINTIRTAQREHAETQAHFVSIYAFQGSGNKPSRYIIKNKPIDNVKHIDDTMYEPCGNTPLYDAVGSTLVDLKTTVAEHEFAIGAVTIITDGYENSSHYYTLEQVRRMISSLKEIGWNFNFIGADINVEAVAQQMDIDNHLAFTKDDEGMAMLCEHQERSRRAYYQRMDDAIYGMSAPKGAAEKKSWFKKMKEIGKRYFEEDEAQEDEKKS